MFYCVVGQTALDLASSEELRLILAAYQDKVGAEKRLNIWASLCCQCCFKLFFYS